MLSAPDTTAHGPPSAGTTMPSGDGVAGTVCFLPIDGLRTSYALLRPSRGHARVDQAGRNQAFVLAEGAGAKDFVARNSGAQLRLSAAERHQVDSDGMAPAGLTMVGFQIPAVVWTS